VGGEIGGDGEWGTGEWRWGAGSGERGLTGVAVRIGGAGAAGEEGDADYEAEEEGIGEDF